MANNNRKLQHSIRPLRSEYRIFTDRASGRTVYIAHNEMEVAGYFDFVCNLFTAGLFTWYAALCIPVVNGHWPLAACVALAFALHQNNSGVRWVTRTLLWAGFWAWWLAT